MTNSKLITILSTFSEEEMKDFEKFSSTFFTAGRNVDAFLKLLKKAHPEFSEKEIKKENVFKKLYPGKEYNDKMMTAQIVSLTKAVEDFLVYKNLQKNSELRDQVLLKEFLERKLFKYFAYDFEALEKDLNNKDTQPDIKFNMLTELYSDASQYYSSIDDFKGMSENLAKYMNSFITMVMMNSFAAGRVDKTLAKYYNLITPPHLFTAFMKAFDINNFLKEINDPELVKFKSTIELYYFLYRAFTDFDEDTDSNEENIERATKAFEAVRDSLKHEEKKIVYHNLDIIYNQVYNSGKYYIKPKIFDLYRSMLNDGIYNALGGKVFDTNMFRSIALGAGDDPEWVKGVIDKYSHLLREDMRESLVSFAKAHLSIAKGNFDEALDHIGKIKYVNFILKTDVKVLTLIIYYEKNYYEEALSVIDTYKHYIASTKDLSPVFKNLFGNFTMIILKLFKLRENYNNNDAEYLKHEIKNTVLPGYDAWLLRKIDELK